MKFSNLYIGTLSGTSADSIDAALFDIGKKIKVVGSISKKIPQNLKSEIIKFSNSNKNLYKHPTKKLKKHDDHFADETTEWRAEDHTTDLQANVCSPDLKSAVSTAK